ncbi:MAG: FAD-dependent oxidoreductase [Mariprofundus sp.]
MTDKPIAIIGGGLSGLTCALRLSEHGKEVHLYESAPSLGGRTRSFYDSNVNQWVDNGPHLLIGAYQATGQLLQDIGASGNVTWQDSLHLPLWDARRGRFVLQPKPWLPFPAALLLSLLHLPGHHMQSVRAMLRIARAMRAPTDETVADWLSRLQIPTQLQRDLIEPLCLGTMNEAMTGANSKSFVRVLSEAFASHRAARLGWFNQPMSQALINPLAEQIQQLGASILTATGIRKIEQQDGQYRLYTNRGDSGPYSAVVVALPAHARNRLLEIEAHVETGAITNVHLWFEAGIRLPEPLIGGIGTYSQWFFDVSTQTGEKDLSHICAVISAESPTDRSDTLQSVRDELAQLLQVKLPDPVHSKIVCEQRATVLTKAVNKSFADGMLIDASEAPQPGDLPATIEAAVIRGEEAAKVLCLQRSRDVIHR